MATHGQPLASDPEAAARAITDAARAHRPRTARWVWLVALAVSAVCAAALLWALARTDATNPAALAPPGAPVAAPAAPRGPGFALGLALGLGGGVALGLALARVRRRAPAP